MANADIENELKSAERSVIVSVASRIAETAKSIASQFSKRIPQAISVSEIREWVGGLGIYIKVDKSIAPQAAAFEHGAKEHPIDARNTRVLKFEGTNEFAGQTIFTPHVDHPGIEPRPFIRPAIDQHRQEANMELMQSIGRSISKVIRVAWREGGGK